MMPRRERSLLAVLLRARRHLAIQQEPGPFNVNWVPSPDPTTPDRVTMHIDWVRRYQATTGSGSPATGS